MRQFFAATAALCAVTITITQIAALDPLVAQLTPQPDTAVLGSLADASAVVKDAVVAYLTARANTDTFGYLDDLLDLVAGSESTHPDVASAIAFLRSTASPPTLLRKRTKGGAAAAAAADVPAARSIHDLSENSLRWLIEFAALLGSNNGADVGVVANSVLSMVDSLGSQADSDASSAGDSLVSSAAGTVNA